MRLITKVATAFDPIDFEILMIDYKFDNCVRSLECVIVLKSKIDDCDESSWAMASIPLAGFSSTFYCMVS